MLNEHGLYQQASNILPIFDITGCFVEKSVVKATSFKAADLLFFYLTKGNGELSLNGRKHRIDMGDFIICRPHETKIFEPDYDEECEFYAVSFKGRYVTDLLSSLNLVQKKNYFVGRDTEIISVIEKIFVEAASNDTPSQIIASSLFITMLGIISRLAITILPRSNDKGYEKIAPALASINSDCTSKISVDDYAKMCNLSTSYFTHLFTKVTGFSPMEYKQLQRISVAKNLLSTTTMSVKEISTIVGFKDPLYFGRCFKQSTGQTPTGYRNKK